MTIYDQTSICDSAQFLQPMDAFGLPGIFASNVNARKTEEDRRANEALGLLYADSDFVKYMDSKNVFMKNGNFDTSLFYDPRSNGVAAPEWG
jgi:hypothetical protein